MQKILMVMAVLLFPLTSFLPHINQANHKQKILAATVMITMETPNWQESNSDMDASLPIPNDEYRTIAKADGYLVAEGLGTMVNNEDEMLLVTHDHWTFLDRALGDVTFRAFDGTFLAKISFHEFKNLIRFRNGGLMTLLVPEDLATAVFHSAKLMPQYDFNIGNRVFLAQRAGEKIIVTEATVIAYTTIEAQPAVRLQSAHGQAVVGGDSGGGIWINGRLVATMWKTVMLENTTTGQRQATDRSMAALISMS